MTDATNKLSEIYNFEQMTDWLGTSGQPEREQFEAIAEAGYRAVINLALPTSDNAIADEASIVTGLGMGYHHIPVKFEEPTVDDLRTFLGVSILEGSQPAEMTLEKLTKTEALPVDFDRRHPDGESKDGV